MSHHPSATSEELSAEGASAPPTTLHSHALGKRWLAGVSEQSALLLQQGNASSHGTLGERAVKPPPLPVASTLSYLPPTLLTFSRPPPTLPCELLPCLSPPPTLPLERKSGRAVKLPARFQEATPEKAINKKGILDDLDEPKASNRGKRAKRASTAEETKQVKKGKRDWASWDEAHHKRKTTRLVALPLHLVDPQRNFQCLLQEFKVCS
jgi:hypothetical protein